MPKQGISFLFLRRLNGSNERLAVKNYPLMVQFYATLILSGQ
jgi:hypothetical protein